MSRIGKLPIAVPNGVTITVDDHSRVVVTGPKGTLESPLLSGINLEQADSQILVKRLSDEAVFRAKHGLMRALINNMVIGVSNGFTKKLEINGVGYRVSAVGENLEFNLGFSHPVKYKIPQGINISLEQNIIKVNGIDKQLVGQVAADIRSLKKPEPYKGKGIKYDNERILRKSGKSGKEK